MSREVASVYFHIGNGGVTFAVVDEGFGPSIVVKSSTFGNNNIEQKLNVTKSGLKTLAKLFALAADKEYSEDYCHAANVNQVKPIYLLGNDEDMGCDPCCGGAPPGAEPATRVESYGQNLKYPGVPKKFFKRQSEDKCMEGGNSYLQYKKANNPEKHCGDDHE